jgi:hypothetical protein
MGYGLIAAVATILSLVVLTAVKGLESRLPKTAPDEKPAAKTEGKKTDDE